MNTSGFISQSQTEEKAKYTVVTKKLTSLISMFDKLYGKSYHTKLIQTDYNCIKNTNCPSVILDNVKINHPLVKLLIEYVKKLDTVGDSSKYFLLVVKYLINESFQIVEKGVKPTVLGEIYRNIGTELNEMCGGFSKKVDIFGENNLEEDLNKMTIQDRQLQLKQDNEKVYKDKELTSTQDKQTQPKQDEEVQPTFSLLLDSLINNKKIKSLVQESILKTKSFSTEKIRIHKMLTGTIEDSYIEEGMVFDRVPDSIRKSLKDGSSAIYNCPLDISRAELKSTILMNTSEELYNFTNEEINFIKEKVDSLKSDLIICSGKVDNIFLDFCNKANKVVFKIMSKHDLRRIRDCLGGSISPVLEPISNLGFVKNMEVFEKSSKLYTKFIGKEIYTIVLRSSLDVVLDEHERVIIKTLRALSQNVKNNTVEVVPGSGIFEHALTLLFKEKADSFSDDLHMKYAFMSLSTVFSNFKKIDKFTFDIYSSKIRAMKYALDFIAVMYETEDYLIGSQEKLNIKPRMNADWDEDH
ncbi:T-complex protein 1 subunit theta (CCT8) [Vairimorpha necatrix]|uniref:T-complex protein 1 subunit theta (CCT8) n=1 Tax=Vairimorpha necatrix TaxID=6039 RepID=A0AAX4JBE3_9MICR